jgi:DNA-binding NarL/FixJ family response regulator
MRGPLILIVEDHPMMVNALCSSMQEVLPQAKFFQANSKAQGLALLEQYDDFALVLLDLNLPDSQGIATLNAFCQARPSNALMVFSMVDDPSVENVCLANRVTYLRKSEPVSRLLDTVLQSLQAPVAYPELPDATVLNARETPALAINDQLSADELLRPLVEEMRLLAEQQHVMLRFRSSFCQVSVETTHVRRMVRNLLTNALRHTQAGGSVLLGCRKQSGRLWIWCMDNGLGMSPAQVNACFEAFTQFEKTEHAMQTLGLGLYSFRHLAEQMQLQVQLDRKSVV